MQEEFSSLRSLVESSLTLAAAAAQPAAHSARDAHHSLCYPEHWHPAASRSGKLIPISRFRGLATWQDAASMLLQASWEAFDGQEGSEHDLLQQAVAHAALPEVVSRLAGFEVDLEEDRVMAVLPDDDVHFDTFVLAALAVHWEDAWAGL
jgi:hypothetical protein